MYRRSDLGKTIYSTLSTMNIQVVGNKKEKGMGNDVADVLLGVEKHINQKKKKTTNDKGEEGDEELKERDEDCLNDRGNEKGHKNGRGTKLERNRTEGMDNERKDGHDWDDENTKRSKKHMSLAERKAEKKKKREEERKAKRK